MASPKRGTKAARYWMHFSIPRFAMMKLKDTAYCAAARRMVLFRIAAGRVSVVEGRSMDQLAIAEMGLHPPRAISA